MTHKELEKILNTSFSLFQLACLSARLSVWMGAFMSSFQRVTLLESAESGWRRVKYSLVAERSCVHKPDVTHCTEGTSSLELHSSTWSYSNPGPVRSDL